MWSVKGPRSTAARLAAFYAVLFSLSVIALGTISVVLVDAALRRQIDTRISAEMNDLLAISSNGSALADVIKSRIGNEIGLKYRLETTTGALLAGNLAPTGSASGWFNFGVSENGQEEAADSFRGYAKTVGGSILTIAEDTDEIENIRDILGSVFTLAALCASVFAVFGGLWLSHFYTRRLDQLANTAEAITGGASTQRMPLTRTSDEFDRLSSSLNRMLDRNQALLESQRQITNDIAHDIRTPLTRLRQKLEVGAVDTAIEEADGLLAILTSLLRIAEIEEGARTANFTEADIAEIARKIEEAYGAPFEEQDKLLSVATDDQVKIQGDHQLLAQLLSNLVENVLIHTPRGTHAQLEARQTADEITLAVTDNGPGIPEADKQLIFRRFYRLDRSRNTPGNGLGLSLVSAIADLHGATLSATNTQPGLKITLIWHRNPAKTKRPTAASAAEGPFKSGLGR